MRFTYQPGARPLDGYTIHRGIHRGGFGEVYYAHSDGGKEVALKLLQHDQEVELRGVRQCLNLKHPNLVSLFDVRTDSLGDQWVVMEYVNGASLEDVLASFPTGLPLEEVQEWLSGIVAGVTYLHDRGIVHRDLKPANVYRENGTVKVGDVGLSKRLGSDRRGEHTQSVGTVYYMAPEVARGQYGPEVDVYSLGVMLYEMLTGQLPFTGESTAEILMKHLTATPSLDGIPDLLRPVVSRALAKDPHRRTSSVDLLNQEFRIALGTTGVEHASELSSVGDPLATSDSAFDETPAVTGSSATTSRGSVPVVIAPPAATKTTAQSASAYAQSPPVPSKPASPKPAPPKPVAPAATPSPKRTHTTTTRSSSRPAVPQINWPLLATVLMVLVLFSPGNWRSWTGIGFLSVAYVATWVLRGRLANSGQSQPGQLTPARDLSSPLGDLATRISLGSVSAPLCAVGTILCSEFSRNTRPQPAEFVALFTATSLVATWLILIACYARQNWSWMKANPRKSFLLIGIATGAVAFGLDQYFLVEYTNPASGYSPAFQSLGVHRLMGRDQNPTLLGYLVFFGGFLFCHRIWDESPRHLHRPLSLGRLCSAGFVGWLLTVIFAFPQSPAILWAIAISAAVQLASTGIPPQHVTGRRQ
jgi:serine/threonine protein kinase